MHKHLVAADWLSLALYFAVVVAIAVWLLFRGDKQSEGYFLAGRRLGWAAVGFSLFASNISSTTLIGLSGSAYTGGLAISAYEWMAAPALVFLAWAVIPRYLELKIYTIPEYFGRCFHRACRPYFSIVTVLGNLFIETAGAVYAGALVLTSLFPSFSLWQAGGILAFLAGLYTAAGGLAAVVYTDVLQAVVLLVGASLSTWLIVQEAGGMTTIEEAVPGYFFRLNRPLDDPTMPWTGMWLGVPVLCLFYWCVNQYVVQRVLGARNLQHARWGAIFAALLKLPVLFIMILPGIAARVVYPELDNPDRVFPTMITTLLPAGVRGLVLAGFIAAIMSSVDSSLNSASTLVTMDFVQVWRENLSDRALGRIGQSVTLVFMTISVLWIPVVAAFGNMFAYLQTSFAYLYPPVAAVFLIGLFWSRLNGKAALGGMIAGHAFGLAALLGKAFGAELELHFLHLTFLLFALSGLIAIGWTWLIAAPCSPAVQASSGRNSHRSDGPLWADWRLQAAAVLALCAWLVVAYW